MERNRRELEAYESVSWLSSTNNTAAKTVLSEAFKLSKFVAVTPATAIVVWTMTVVGWPGNGAGRGENDG